MNAILIYNKQAGKGRMVAHIDKIVDIFREEGIEIRPKALVFDVNPFDDEDNLDLVVICGGDGTVNSVVNSMFHRGISPQIGILPGGTANDFAGMLGMPRSVYKSARKIARGKVNYVDCGVVNNKYFVNVLSFGMFTTTSQRTPDMEKRIAGRMAYIRVGMREALSMRHMRLHINSGGEEFDVDALVFLAFIGNTAGRIKLAHDAKVDDGMFDVVIFKYGNIFRMAISIFRYMVLHQKPSDVCYLRTSHLQVSSAHSELTDVDGQQGPDLPMDIRCIPGGLKIRL